MKLLKIQFITPVIYLLIVVICIFLAFDFSGRLNSSDWWLALCVLTLPWSMVSVLFMWAIFHGAGLEIFTLMYLFFASINAYLIYLIAKPKNKPIQEDL